MVLSVQLREVVGVALDEQPRPAEHVGEEHTVALVSGLDAEFDEETRRGTDPGEDLDDDAVLQEHLSFVASQIGGREQLVRRACYNGSAMR